MVLDKTLISLCIPCMNRAYALKKTMPYTLIEANSSPPVEICVLDYNSQDDLAEFIAEIKVAELAKGNTISYYRYTDREYYHLAHAYNLTVMLSAGEYFVIAQTDGVFRYGYINTLRELIAEGCVWMRSRYKKGIICCQKKEFVDAGGYDERFEFYGGDDRELESRLTRRVGKPCLVPDGMVGTIRTPREQQVANYRGNMTKKEMCIRGKKIRDENDKNQVLVVNEGIEWGKGLENYQKP